MERRRSPRFPIVLPTHNRADVLPFAIRSALWQTADDFELLIVGDGCTDRTRDVVASFDDARIQWLDLPKAPGVGYANRNVALRQSRGDYVAYLAHDDLWLPDHLERLGSLLDDGGAELAYSRMLAVSLDGRITPSWYNLEIPSHQAGLWRGDMFVAMSCEVHTRSCVEKYGDWDEGLLKGGDVELWHRILAPAAFRNVAFLSEPTAIHFVAGWRGTTGFRARMRMAGWLQGGLLDNTLPDALKLPAGGHHTQQEVLFRRLADDPPRGATEIRGAVVQFQDALLWKARTIAGFTGLRFGLAVGAGLLRAWRVVRWLSLGDVRRVYRRLRARTRPREEQRAANGAQEPPSR
jgi:glycosyltransferase involved in cell wall biosynthesis